MKYLLFTLNFETSDLLSMKLNCLSLTQRLFTTEKKKNIKVVSILITFTLLKTYCTWNSYKNIVFFLLKLHSFTFTSYFKTLSVSLLSTPSVVVGTAAIYNAFAVSSGAHMLIRVMIHNDYKLIYMYKRFLRPGLRSEAIWSSGGHCTLSKKFPIGFL